ncbi:pilus assembly protein [Vibrio sp. 16]|uniref:TadE/TadG family type IV pilus assembly protein n=1 Tax=Vibrio sp. 16 TaxID=391586 RepID=UPI002FF323D6
MFRQKSRQQKGITIVEFTAVSALFMLMIFAIIEGGRYIYTKGAIAHLAREGARYAAVRGAQATKDPLRTGDAPATQSSVDAYIENRSPVGGVTTTLTWSPNNTPGSEVTVTVSYQFTSLITLLNEVDVTNSATSIVYF